MGNIAVFTHSSGSEVVRNVRVRIKYNLRPQGGGGGPRSKKRFLPVGRPRTI